MSCPLQHWGKYISGLEVTISTKTFHKKSLSRVWYFSFVYVSHFVFQTWCWASGTRVLPFLHSYLHFRNHDRKPTSLSSRKVRLGNFLLLFTFLPFFCHFLFHNSTFISATTLDTKKENLSDILSSFHFANVKHAMELISSSTRVKVSTFP